MSRAVPDEDDRVRRDAAGQTPGEVEVAPLGVRRRAAADDLPRRGIVRGRVGRADEDGAARGPDGPERIRRTRRPRSSTPSDGSTTRRRLAFAARMPGPRRRTPARRRPRGTGSARPLGCGRVDRPGERDDPAERGHRIAGERRVPRLAQGRPLGRAARVRVLDDHAGRAAKGAREGGRGGRVEDVVVAERPCPGAAARCRRTVRRPSLLPAAGSGPQAGAGSRRSAASRPSRARSSASLGTGRSRRAGRARPEARRRQPPSGPAARPRSGRRRRRCGGTPRSRGSPGAHRGTRPSSRDRREDRVVAGGRGHDRDAGVVLGGRPDHRRPADVDLLDELVERDPGPVGGRGERVEVDDDELERGDPGVDQLATMIGEPAVGEDARRGPADGAS